MSLLVGNWPQHKLQQSPARQRPAHARTHTQYTNIFFKPVKFKLFASAHTQFHMSAGSTIKSFTQKNLYDSMQDLISEIHTAASPVWITVYLAITFSDKSQPHSAFSNWITPKHVFTVTIIGMCKSHAQPYTDCQLPNHKTESVNLLYKFLIIINTWHKSKLTYDRLSFLPALYHNYRIYHIWKLNLLFTSCSLYRWVSVMSPTVSRCYRRVALKTCSPFSFTIKEAAIHPSSN